jgi:Flp pilus assembly protein TadG
MRKLLHDSRAVAAIEFAILAPLMCAMIGWSFDLYQATMQKSAAQFVAQASAVVGGRSLNRQGGAIAAATTSATAAFNANTVAFILGAVPALGAIQAIDATGNVTSDDTAAVALSVTVTAQSPAIFPVFIGDTIATTAKVQS